MSEMIKSIVTAAAIVGFTLSAPMVAFAQSQLAEELKPMLMELGMDSSDVDKIDNASEEQLTQIEAIVSGEGAEMTKQDEISSILAEVE
jgi:hypothetical protein